MTQPSSHAQSPETAPETDYPEFQSRLVRALAPAAGALVLDFADLITIGPFGIYGGLIIGITVGWWMSGMHNFGRRGRVAVAIASGLYCMMPATHFLPLATILSATGRFLDDPKSERA